MPDIPQNTPSRDLIERARFIVGVNPPGNFYLMEDALETKHIAPLDCFLDEGAPLIARLHSQTVVEILQRYAAENRTAIAEQGAYQRLSKLVTIPILLAFGLSLMVVLIRFSSIAEFIVWAGLGFNTAKLKAASSAIHDWEVFLAQVVPWVILLLMMASPLLAMKLAPDCHFGAWQKARGAAEALRREYFRRIMLTDRADTEAMQPGSQLLRLEYFRRWQVELQQQYFIRNQQRHAAIVTRADRWRRGFFACQAALLVVLLASCLASTDEQQRTAWLPASHVTVTSPIERLGVDYILVVAGLMTLLAGAYYFFQKSLGASGRNSARYLNMQTNFEALLATDPLPDGRDPPLTAARKGAAAGSPQALTDYMDRVHSIMSIELNDWVRLADLDQGRDPIDYARDAPSPAVPAPPQPITS